MCMPEKYFLNHIPGFLCLRAVSREVLQGADAIVIAVLTASPESACFAPAVLLCRDVDVAASLFWTTARRDRECQASSK